MQGLFEFVTGLAMGGLIALLFFGLGCSVQRKIDNKEDDDDD